MQVGATCIELPFLYLREYIIVETTSQYIVVNFRHLPIYVHFLTAIEKVIYSGSKLP
jgi:hypothetical protein